MAKRRTPAGRARHIVVRVIGLDEVRARVAASYDRLRLPTWPNPHPGMAIPRDEEYSRLTEPGRYRIVHARARAWADGLVELAGAAAEPLPPDREVRTSLVDGYDRGVRLTSPRPGTLPLLLLERDVPQPGREPLAVLHIGVIEPQVTLVMLPDCGCDACDLGSQDLLDAIDETIGHVVGGPFVALWGPGWQAHWYPDGGSTRGTGTRVDHRQAMELCRRLAQGDGVRLPRGVEALVGVPWLD